MESCFEDLRSKTIQWKKRPFESNEDYMRVFGDLKSLFPSKGQKVLKSAYLGHYPRSGMGKTWLVTSANLTPLLLLIERSWAWEDMVALGWARRRRAMCKSAGKLDHIADSAFRVHVSPFFCCIMFWTIQPMKVHGTHYPLTHWPLTRHPPWLSSPIVLVQLSS